MYLNVNAVLETLFNTKLYCPWNRKCVALDSVITKITFQFQEQYYLKGHFLHLVSYPYIVDLNREFPLISKRLCTDIDCKRAWSLNERRIEIWDDLEFALVDSLNWNMVIVIYQIKFIYEIYTYMYMYIYVYMYMFIYIYIHIWNIYIYIYKWKLYQWFSAKKWKCFSFVSFAF